MLTSTLGLCLITPAAGGSQLPISLAFAVSPVSVTAGLLVSSAVTVQLAELAPQLYAFNPQWRVAPSKHQKRCEWEVQAMVLDVPFT